MNLSVPDCPRIESEPTPLTSVVRVLHVVENLDNQAVETWLLRVLRAGREVYPHIHWTFFCVLGKEGRLDPEARALGAEVIHSHFEVGDKRRFLLSLRDVMKRGHYDILHCHHDIMSAAYLAAAAGLPFRKRIVHVHNTSLSLPTPNKLKAGVVRTPMKQMCLRMADQIVGISGDALECLVGIRVGAPSSQTVVHYGVETSRFAQANFDRAKLRRQLDLSSAARILLFVGRMTEYKNPCFLLDILEQVIGDEPEAVAVFAGVGPLESELDELAKKKGVQHRIRQLGFRDDVPDLMLSSDILVWPSVEIPKEGLGLGIIEAQAAGLPIVMSKSVPEEAIVVAELVETLPLSAGAIVWGEKVAQILHKKLPAQSEALSRVEASTYSMKAGVGNLMALYED